MCARGSSAARSGNRVVRSSPSTVATRTPLKPCSRAVSIAAARRGRVDAARVGDDLRAPVGDERKGGEVRGQVTRVPERLVAPVLLQDREGELGERLEAEVVDALGEQGVDRRRRVAVEALPAGDLHIRPLIPTDA